MTAPTAPKAITNITRILSASREEGGGVSPERLTQCAVWLRDLADEAKPATASVALRMAVRYEELVNQYRTFQNGWLKDALAVEERSMEAEQASTAHQETDSDSTDKASDPAAA